MKPIRNLDRVWGALLRRLRVSAGSVAADDFDFWMLLKPALDRVRGAVR